MKTQVSTEIRKGSYLKNRRDDRIVRVDVANFPTYRVVNTASGKRTTLKWQTIQKEWAVTSQAPAERVAPKAKKPKPVAAPLTSDRQRTVLRVIKKKFSDFQKRQQHFYLGAGMTTTHAVVAVMADVDDIHLFWPSELVKNKTFGGHTYVLEKDVFRRVQDRILRTMNELEKSGHLEKVGNTDERRWKPTYA